MRNLAELYFKTITIVLVSSFSFDCYKFEMSHQKQK